jgi:hypothetical protein
MMAVLNDKQKQDFTTMKGKPFDLTALRPMGGGAGGQNRPASTKD